MSHINERMKYHELQAMWWMHSASNGHSSTRTVHKGYDGPLMTAEELRDDAMKTSQHHMNLYLELSESKL